MLEDDSIGNCEKKQVLYEHLVYNSEWLEEYKYKRTVHGNKEREIASCSLTVILI
jgi:hypothetical protein